MRAAEPLEELSAGERERIRHRLHAAVATSHRAAAGFRWSTALAALGLLLAGGAVFAAAGHFGLIPWPRETKLQSESEPAGSSARRRPARAVRLKSAVASSPTGTVNEGDAPVPEEIPAVAQPPVAEPALAPPSSAPIAPEAAPPLAVFAPALSKQQAARAVRASHVAPAPAPGAATNRQAVLGETPRSPSMLAIAAPAIAPPPAAEPGLAPPSSDRLVAQEASRVAMLAPAASPARVSRLTPAPASAPKAATSGQAMLGQALRSLRNEHDPASALDVLARHAALFPQSPLASERSVLEVEALLALGRRDEALLRLDGMSLDNTPRSAERHVVRGELRARAQRWREAAADFDQALAHASGTSAWQERALWGRAVARMRVGDEVAARADLQLYLGLYPTGRFASEAARLLAAKR